jgi:hypothetical protein
MSASVMAMCDKLFVASLRTDFWSSQTCAYRSDTIITRAFSFPTSLRNEKNHYTTLSCYMFPALTPCSPLKINRRFGKKNILLLFSKSKNKPNKKPTIIRFLLHAGFLLVLLEATCFSETSVDFQRTTRQYIPVDRTLRRDNLFRIAAAYSGVPGFEYVHGINRGKEKLREVLQVTYMDIAADHSMHLCPTPSFSYQI